MGRSYPKRVTDETVKRNGPDPSSIMGRVLSAMYQGGLLDPTKMFSKGDPERSADRPGLVTRDLELGTDSFRREEALRLEPAARKAQRYPSASRHSALPRGQPAVYVAGQHG